MGLFQNIAWSLYQKGYGTPKAEYLHLARPGDPMWFKVADELYKENNLSARKTIMDQLLVSSHFKAGPRRVQFLKLLGFYLNKGIVDERRRAVTYIDNNAGLFAATDDVIMGPLITAQRDSDIVTSNTAEEALLKIRGEVKHTREDYR